VAELLVPDFPLEALAVRVNPHFKKKTPRAFFSLIVYSDEVLISSGGINVQSSLAVSQAQFDYSRQRIY
jgi:hypothetical protein